MDNDVQANLKEQSGNPLGAEPEEQRLDLRGKSVAEIVTMLTSGPIERAGGTDQPLTRAPQSPPVAPEPSRFTDAPPMAPGIGGPNLDFQPREDLSEPPIRTGRRPAATRFGRLSFAAILAAIVAGGVTLVMFPGEVGKRAADVSAMVTALFDGSSRRTQKPAKPARLVVENQKGFANEPLALGVTPTDVSGAETVTLAGLAIGTKLSAGAPLGLTSWQMTARDVGNAVVYAPKDFLGAMDVVIDLRSAMGDWLMDGQTVRLEWVQKSEARPTPPPEPSRPPPTIPTLDPAEVATLVRNFLKNGDIASARLLLKQSANAGNAQAALELGMTFDPVFLKKWNVPGFAPDAAQAREWYNRAIKLGSSEASRHLEQLTGAEE